MKSIDIAKAWKDKDYRDSLSQEELAVLPANPAGKVHLDDDSLESINGGLHLFGSLLCTPGTYEFDQNASCRCVIK